MGASRKPPAIQGCSEGCGGFRRADGSAGSIWWGQMHRLIAWVRGCGNLEAQIRNAVTDLDAVADRPD